MKFKSVLGALLLKEKLYRNTYLDRDGSLTLFTVHVFVLRQREKSVSLAYGYDHMQQTNDPFPGILPKIRVNNEAQFDGLFSACPFVFFAVS